MKTAIVTGITGQDGAYLADSLLKKGYQVYGTYRRSSTVNFWRIDALNVRSHAAFALIEHDITDLGSCIRLIEKCQADEVYHLAAQSFVGVSFDQPVATSEITGLGTTNMLEAIRIVNPRTRFYQASSSEMFGLVQAVPQSETTPFYPRSPYGVAKLYAHWMTVNYRESYGLFATSGILFNHESPLRGKEFVTRKITHAVARIFHGQLDCLELGNLDASRDWGFAGDYVEGMYRMLQADEPGTYVLATQRSETVRQFVSMSFAAIGTSLEWVGTGVDERALDARTGQVRVRINPAFYRPAEVDLLIGDASLARQQLGWQASTTLEQLCERMVRADLERVESGFAW